LNGVGFFDHAFRKGQGEEGPDVHQRPEAVLAREEAPQQRGDRESAVGGGHDGADPADLQQHLKPTIVRRGNLPLGFVAHETGGAEHVVPEGGVAIAEHRPFGDAMGNRRPHVGAAGEGGLLAQQTQDQRQIQNRREDEGEERAPGEEGDADGQRRTAARHDQAQGGADAAHHAEQTGARSRQDHQGRAEQSRNDPQSPAFRLQQRAGHRGLGSDHHDEAEFVLLRPQPPPSAGIGFRVDADVR